MDDRTNNRHKMIVDCLIALVIILITRAHLSLLNTKIERGPESTAVIKQVWQGKGSREYYAVYAYSVRDSIYYGVCLIDNKDSLTVGSHIHIHYLRNHPHHSTIIENSF